MVTFNTRMRPEVVQPFWAALQAGEFITAAAQSVGTYRVMGRRWILAESGIRPRRGEYRATAAHALAWQRASRPKPAKLWVNQRLREIVEDLLERRYSLRADRGAPAREVPC